MTIEGHPADILQVEVILDDDEYAEHYQALGDIATTLAEVSLDITPVVTSRAYKYGLNDELNGSAETFRQQLLRASSPDQRGLMEHAQAAYGEALGLNDESQETAAEGISDWILTLATRKSFIDAVGALDTAGVKQRVERMRGHSGWMICILDASQGWLTTAKDTEQVVDAILEADYGDALSTKINPDTDESPDVPVFSKPQTLREFLDTQGFLSGQDRADGVPQTVIDMAEMYEIFMTADEPNNRSLEEFEWWIGLDHSFQRQHRDYLMALRDEMQAAAEAPNAQVREDAVKSIRASLTDALLQGMEPHIVRECARVLNKHVVAAPLLQPRIR